MSGRNSKPDNDGPASQPAKLGQFGDKAAKRQKSAKSAEACDPPQR
jgi:hypothetical protein